MPHLIMEIARGALERRLKATPIETDASGNPVDILNPPFPIRRSFTTPLSEIRIQLIVRSVTLGGVPGSAQTSLSLTFDEGSIEVFSSGVAEGMIAGGMTVPFALGFVAAPRPVPTDPNAQAATLMADFSATNVIFTPDGNSMGRLSARLGPTGAAGVVAAISGALTAIFRSLGAQPTGVRMRLTPNVPSEEMLTVFDVPWVVWVNADTLAVALRYAAEPFPPPFMPTPFLPPGPSAFGIRLSNDGFQRTVRNPALRRLAREMLAERMLDGFIRDAFAQRGGTGPITDADKENGRKLFDDFLKTPQGIKDLANETPAPAGTGKLRKRVKKVPDPFSDFDIEIPELNLWLGNDRIEGFSRAEGKVNGFGMKVSARFRARPVLVSQPEPSIELHDIEIDEPEIEIDLPFWLEFGLGTLVTMFAGPVYGVIVAFIFSSVLASLAEMLVPSDLGSKVPPPDAESLGTLPPGVTLTELHTVPEFLSMNGRWSVTITDPEPFNPFIRVIDEVERTRVGPTRQGVAWLTCWGALGIVGTSDERFGTRFEYKRSLWRTKMTLRLEATGVPHPLQHFAWTIAVGHGSPKRFQNPGISTPAQVVAPGNLTFNTPAWRPEPPLNGQVENVTFTMGVQRPNDETCVLDIPADARCILVVLKIKVVDAAGAEHNLTPLYRIVNESVAFGDDYDRFSDRCKQGRKEYVAVEEPSLLDTLWNPPEVFARQVQRAIRHENPGVTTDLAGVIEEHGVKAFDILLAPSKMMGR